LHIAKHYFVKKRRQARIAQTDFVAWRIEFD
jgi:hypothetical protein